MNKSDSAKEKQFPMELINIELLKQHTRNYRKHPDDELAHIKESIRANGIYRNIIVAKDNTILAGHGVVEAARQLGYEQVPVYRLNVEPNSTRALKVLTGDNYIAHLSFDDDRLFSELLKEILASDETGLLGTGFDEQMLSAFVMVTRPAQEIANHDEAKRWVGMPEYENIPDPLKVIVSLHTQADKDRFAEMLGVELPERQTVSVWWPRIPDERRETKDTQFVFENEA